ncbi:MAG: hypothetical protein GY754_35300 [bacterium]|nr:hypothetical protein [bacterium]
MLKRTPILGLLISAIASIAIILIIEVPERPFTTGQGILLYITAFFPSMGIAMLFDPFSKEAKERYLKRNFYEEQDLERERENN